MEMFQLVKARIRSFLDKIWNDKTPRGKVLFIEYVCWLLMRFGGVESCGPRYYLSFMTYVFNIAFFSTYACIIWTVYSNPDDRSTAVKAFVPMPASIVVNNLLIKVMVFKTIGSQSSMVRRLVLYNSQNLYTSDDVDEYTNLRTDQLKKLMKNLWFFVGLFAVTGVVLVLIPIYEYLFRGQPFYFLNVFLPFMDPFSTNGIMINNCYHSFMYPLAFCPLSGSLIAWVLGLSTIDTQVAIIKFDLQKAAKTKSRTLIHIFRKINEADRYIVMARDCSYAFFFVAPFLYSLTIVMAVVCVISRIWVGGFAYVVAVYMFIFICCHIGQKIMDAYDEMAEALMEYWYVFPLNEQKAMHTMLCRLQNGATITIGPLSTLNYAKFQGITNKIYNLSLALLEFLR